MSDELRLFVVAALIAGNAFFVIAEYAIVTARRRELLAAAEAGSRGARSALRLMDDPVRVISTVQVGITAIGILTGAVGESAIRDVLGNGIPAWASFVIAFGSVTYFSVVLGELVPKALALEAAERVATVVARPVELIGFALAPLVKLLQLSAKVVLRPLGIRDVVAGEGIRSAEELRALVDEAEGSGLIPRAQEEMLDKVFEFSDRSAGDVMVPALDVAWLDASTSPARAVDRMVEEAHTRYPVGRGSVDRVIGVVHARDLVAAERAGEPETIEALARPAIMVPEGKPLVALLRELREARQQLALVLDEYGRTLGIVTLEDLVEEIVGEIEDEHDLPRATLTWKDGRSVVVAGTTTIDDLTREVGAVLQRTDARTVGGVLLERLGRRPRPGDRVEVDGVVLRAQRVEHSRIVEVAVELPEPAEEGA